MGVCVCENVHVGLGLVNYLKNYLIEAGIPYDNIVNLIFISFSIEI